jgi:spoIIIJ-associated protein
MKHPIHDFLTTMFNKLQFDVSDIHVEMIKPGEFYVNIETDDAPLFTMWNGDVLRALQHILSSVCRSQKFLEEDAQLKVDICGYRKKQEESVIKMAEERIKKTLETKSTQILPPMSPYFRRLIHMYVAEKYDNLSTESAGEGDHRHIRIRMKEAA